MPEKLKAPPIPHAFERAMRLWQDLHRRRSTGGMGLGNLSWQDLHAYCQVTGESIGRGDEAAIDIIESEFHASRADAEERRTKAETAKRR